MSTQRAQPVSEQFRELASATDARREALMRAGTAPTFESLVGFEWCGYNASTLIRLLGLQKFIKGFFQGPDHVEGYNIPVLQNGIDAQWLPQPNPETPKRYAFYQVTYVETGSKENLYPAALLLNYGASTRNPARSLERALRDYLVQLDPANPDLLLGKAYWAVGSYRIPSNFFVLERLSRVSWTP